VQFPVVFVVILAQSLRATHKTVTPEYDVRRVLRVYLLYIPVDTRESKMTKSHGYNTEEKLARFPENKIVPS
jgi:hypothetical protein